MQSDYFAPREASCSSLVYNLRYLAIEATVDEEMELWAWVSLWGLGVLIRGQRLSSRQTTDSPHVTLHVVFVMYGLSYQANESSIDGHMEAWGIGVPIRGQRFYSIPNVLSLPT